MTGEYLPGPPSTGADYWVGDTVTLAYSGLEGEGVEYEARVWAVTVTRNDDNAELVAVPELRLIEPLPPAEEAFAMLAVGCGQGNAIPDMDELMYPPEYGGEELVQWAHSGDDPPTGDSTEPLYGPIEYITKEGEGSPGHPWRGIRVLTNGTAAVDAHLEWNGVAGVGDWVTFSLWKNGTKLDTAYAESGSFGAWYPDLEITFANVPIEEGDTFELTQVFDSWPGGSNLIAVSKHKSHLRVTCNGG